jgi:leader peptidase (prepilin peptidase)/N-methyltransferase
MYDGMPNALAVGNAAARIEWAWGQVATSVRISTTTAILASSAIVVGGSSSGVDGWWAVCGVLLALAALVDVHEQRLPNGVLAFALLVSLVPICIRMDAVMAARATLGGLLAGGMLLVVQMARGVGIGDVKMAAVVGASVGSVGWRTPLVAVAVAAASGSVYGLVRRRRRVAFGPALWFGWMSALIGLSTGWWS